MKNLISIFGILVIVTCVFCQKTEEMRKIREECRAELGLPEPHGFHVLPKFDDPKEKCYFACLMKKEGHMEDGKINLKKAYESHIKMFPGVFKNAEEILTGCIEIANKESDECEVAVSAIKCALEKFGFPRHPKK